MLRYHAALFAKSEMAFSLSLNFWIFPHAVLGKGSKGPKKKTCFGTIRKQNISPVYRGIVRMAGETPAEKMGNDAVVWVMTY